MNFTKLNYAEPSVLRGIITAVVALAASLGYVIPADVSAAATAAIPTLAVLIPLGLSVWTRFHVFSPKAIDDAIGRHAAPEV